VDGEKFEKGIGKGIYIYISEPFIKDMNFEYPIPMLDKLFCHFK